MPILTSDEEIKNLLATSRTIAIVGISDRPYRDSYTVASYLLRTGYIIVPVNPRIASVLGMKSYPSLESTPVAVDIVNVFRRPEYVPAIVESAVHIKARALWLQVGVIHERAAEHAAASGLHVVMDRCLMVEHSRLALVHNQQ